MVGEDRSCDIEPVACKLPALGAETRGSCGNYPSWRLLEDFVQTLVDETADALLPVSWAVDAFFDWVAEQKREKYLGGGLFLGTIHAAKGMEFAHVVILDGDWTAPGDPGKMEEERRTLYVGMTRAKETLALMKSRQRPNPFLRELWGDAVCIRQASAPAELPADGADRRYEMLGMKAVYLGYAGRFPPADSIHRHLAQTQAGDRVFLSGGDPVVEIRSPEGVCLGKLSQSASAKWRDKLDRVSEVRVVALVERRKTDEQDAYRSRIQAERWEVPVIEVVTA